VQKRLQDGAGDTGHDEERGEVADRDVLYDVRDQHGVGQLVEWRQLDERQDRNPAAKDA
jgi:hypothetical protein